MVDTTASYPGSAGPLTVTPYATNAAGVTTNANQYAKTFEVDTELVRLTLRRSLKRRRAIDQRRCDGRTVRDLSDPFAHSTAVLKPHTGVRPPASLSRASVCTS
jgi:hypothetical protein